MSRFLLSAMILSTGCVPPATAPPTPAPAPRLAFTIALPKTTFAAGEAIVLTMVLRNVSAQTVTVNRRLAVNEIDAPSPFRDVAMQIKKPSGGEAEFRWELRIGFPGPAHFVQLAPAEGVTETVDIADQYTLDQKGEYTITATYENTFGGPSTYNRASGKYIEQDLGAVRAKIDSNSVTFRIY